MLDLRPIHHVSARRFVMLSTAFPNEVCLIEAERDRENLRLTYSDFKEIALPLARALEDADFDPNDRAAIIMTNQSKWLISAYAIFYCGGVLVPLDYKLTAAEHLQLLAHSQSQSSGRRVSLVAGDYAVAGFQSIETTDRPGDRSPAGRGSGGRISLGRFQAQRARPISSCARKTMSLASSIPREPAAVPKVVSSLTRIIWSNAGRLTAWYPVLARSAVSEHSAHESCH